MTPDPIPDLKRQVAEALRSQLQRHYDEAAGVLMVTDRARVSNIRHGHAEGTAPHATIGLPSNISRPRDDLVAYCSTNISRIVRPGCTNPH